MIWNTHYLCSNQVFFGNLKKNLSFIISYNKKKMKAETLKRINPTNLQLTRIFHLWNDSANSCKPTNNWTYLSIMNHLSPEGSLPQDCSSAKLPFKFSDDGEVASEKNHQRCLMRIKTRDPAILSSRLPNSSRGFKHWCSTTASWLDGRFFIGE